MITEKSLERDKYTTSVSQATTYDLCARKWWFGWIKKMPQVEKGYLTFGTIIHEICERYLRADMQGRDRETGQAVDLFPEGWEKTTEGRGKFKREVSITPSEQELARKLIRTAIEEGFLHREHDLKIEHKFRLTLLDDPNLDTVVEVLGFIDVMDSEGIQDHKTVGNWKYALGVKRLAKDPQVLLYACVWCWLREKSGAPLPEKIKVQHNQYGKDPSNPKARKTVAHVTPEQAQGMWTWMQNVSRNMLRDRKVEKWHEVEAALPETGACNKYGGCDYRDICSGRETPEKYVERVLRVNARSLNSESRPKPKIRRSEDMAGSLFKNRLANRAKPSPKPEAEKAPAKEAEATTATGTEAPPWANPKCKVCGGSGFNKAGNACRLCDATAKKNGTPQSTDYVIETVEGERFWEAKNGNDSGSATTPEADTPVKTKESVADEPPAEEEAAPEETAPEETASEETAPEESEEEPAAPKVSRGRGRPKKGFTLLIGCGVSKGVPIASMLCFEDIFTKLSQALVEERGEDASSYFEMNAFQRRDLMCAKLPDLLEEFGTKTIIVRSADDAETKAILPVLRSMATLVIE